MINFTIRIPYEIGPLATYNLAEKLSKHDMELFYRFEDKPDKAETQIKCTITDCYDGFSNLLKSDFLTLAVTACQTYVPRHLIHNIVIEEGHEEY